MQMVEEVMSSESVKRVPPHLQWFHSVVLVLQMADVVAVEVSAAHR
jgi:hypothetical protein